MPATTTQAPPGLEGVAVAATAIGEVRGDEGFFHYRGRDATALAVGHTLEEVWHLVLLDHLPRPGELERFRAEVAAARAAVPTTVLAGVAEDVAAGAEPLAALRSGWSRAAAALGCRPWLDLADRERRRQAIALAAMGPVLLAATVRPPDDLARRELPAGTAAALLTLVLGGVPDTPAVAALERYLTLTIDHGLNASTFTARTVTSTGADLGAVLVAALGALSGPLHGGAPSRVLEMLDAIGTPDRAEAWVAAALARGERIMGFGHRVYRTEDPRARMLRAVAQDLGGPRVDLAVEVEDVARRQLRARHPDRPLDVNVEYYAAVVLDGVGLPRTLFTPTFAVARSIGWMAHALEQMEGNRIVRPTARYIGPAPARPGS